MSSEKVSDHFIACIPVFDDWDSAMRLIVLIDQVLTALSSKAQKVKH